MPNELAGAPAAWTTAQTRAQFLAIAWLRWRILANGFRRRGGAGELIARILLWPLFGVLALLPTLGVGAAAFFFARGGRLDRVALLLWGTFVVCQLLNIQLGQPGTTFDPTQLIRFPLRTSGYVCIRLFFGLLTPANVIGTMMCFAIAIGISIAMPGLWLYSLAALSVFAATNILFSRMVFAWIDRWLATRRAREIVTGLIFVISVGIQWANFTYNPAYHRHGHRAPTARFDAMTKFRAFPLVQLLPPELTSRSIVAAHMGVVGNFFRLTLGCAAFAAFFLAVFAMRMKTEFRGENLSDAANAVARAPKKASARKSAVAVLPQVAARHEGLTMAGVPSPILGMLGKELLYLRRNMGLFYSVVAPLVFVFLFAGRLATRGVAVWVFPAAVAYALLGISPLSYNSFGLEGAGAQFYFFAPVRLRDVLLAKNLMNFGTALLEAAAVFGIVTYVAGVPPATSVAVALLWAAGTLMLTTILGNRRSLSTPKQSNLARAAGKQASPLSAMIGMGILVLSGSLATAIFGLALYFRVTWPLVPVFAVFFGGALWAYLSSLKSLDAFALEHREELFAELCKKV
jgi:ABC-2 type transport system permease protein